MRASLKQIPKSIWALGLVSACINISSVMVFTLSPHLLTSMLGASIMTLGLIDGIVEATALSSRIISGLLSDYLKKRKALLVVAYSISTLVKPIFALAPTIGWVFFARFTDRITNGLQASPRDALVADLTPPELKGTCYGMRQSLGTLGSVVGAILVTTLLLWQDLNIPLVFWVSMIPAFLALLVLSFKVKEPEAAPVDPAHPHKRVFHFEDIKHLGRSYWTVVFVAGFFMLGRFSEALLIVRAEKLHLPLAYLPAVLITMNLFSTLAAVFLGRLADRFDHRLILKFGFLALIIADILLAWAQTPWQALMGVMFWGIQVGVTQSIFAVMIADTCPAKMRGTGFGFYYLLSGVAILAANLSGGWLWEAFSPEVTFMASAVIGTLTLLFSGLILKGRQFHS